MKKLLLTVLALSVIIINPNSFAYASWPSTHPAGAFYASIELFEDIEIYEHKFDLYIWEEFGECWVEIVPITVGIRIYAGQFTVIQGGVQNSHLRFATINDGPESLSYYIPTVLKIAYLPYMSPYEIDLSKPFTLIYDLGGGDLVTMNVPALMGGTTPDPDQNPEPLFTQADLDAAYQNGYTAGKQACIEDPVSCGIGDTLIFVSGNPVIQSSAEITAYGNSEINTITLKSQAKASLMNFPNANEVIIQSNSNLFQVHRSGTVVTFQGSDGTELNIPATKDIQIISFNDRSLTLSIYNNQVMLDDQVIGQEMKCIQ